MYTVDDGTGVLQCKKWHDDKYAPVAIDAPRAALVKHSHTYAHAHAHGNNHENSLTLPHTATG
jgi:hypothetical protein